MKKEEETTSRLEQSLKEVDDDRKADAFINEHCGNAWDSFSDYYLKYVGKHDEDISEIVASAGFGDYASQIINGIRKPVNRDRIIALCLAAGMSVTETDRALRLADHFPLNPKDERDVRIVVCINNGMNKVVDVNLELDRFGLPPLE